MSLKPPPQRRARLSIQIMARSPAAWPRHMRSPMGEILTPPYVRAIWSRPRAGTVQGSHCELGPMTPMPPMPSEPH